MRFIHGLWVRLSDRCVCSAMFHEVQLLILQLVTPCNNISNDESGFFREHTNSRINTASPVFKIPGPLARLFTVHKLRKTSITVLLPMACDRAFQISPGWSLLTVALRLVEAVVLSADSWIASRRTSHELAFFSFSFDLSRFVHF